MRSIFVLLVFCLGVPSVSFSADDSVKNPNPKKIEKQKDKGETKENAKKDVNKDIKEDANKNDPKAKEHPNLKKKIGDNIKKRKDKRKNKKDGSKPEKQVRIEDLTVEELAMTADGKFFIANPPIPSPNLMHHFLYGKTLDKKKGELVLQK